MTPIPPVPRQAKLSRNLLTGGSELNSSIGPVTYGIEGGFARPFSIKKAPLFQGGGYFLSLQVRPAGADPRVCLGWFGLCQGTLGYLSKAVEGPQVIFI